MRINFLSIAAVVLAIGTFAFTTIEKKAQVDMFVFEYDDDASGGYAELDVENISNTNWKYVGKNLSLCSDDDQKACRVAVRGTYVNNTVTPTALQNVTIDATLSGSTAHVQSISGTGSQLSNQPD
jgi:hypothetical protein